MSQAERRVLIALGIGALVVVLILGALLVFLSAHTDVLTIDVLPTDAPAQVPTHGKAIASLPTPNNFATNTVTPTDSPTPRSSSPTLTPTITATPAPSATRTTNATPPFKIIPDSDLIYSPSAADFDVAAYIGAQPGLIHNYSESVSYRKMTGAEIVAFVATNTSVNPRLLLGLLEYQGAWLTNPTPDTLARQYPLGYQTAQEKGLFNQVMWAANTLNEGYYGVKTRGATSLKLRDRTALSYAPGLNPGTIAVQYLFAEADPNRARWENDVSAGGFLATYIALFGDPTKRAVEPLIPADLKQPEFLLPFSSGELWYFSAGPHGGWGRTTSGWAAIDFAPPNPPDELIHAEGKCYVSPYYATAVVGGLVVRSNDGAVIIDVDGDGNEHTGWTVLYLHIASQDRVAVGTFVQPGSLIGHPSCEGFYLNSPGTHLHIARRYNGEWIPADCKVCQPGITLPPFVLGGWRVLGSPNLPTQGWLKNGSQVRRLMEGRDETINGVSW